jgi:hypothetical protein
VEEVRTAPGSTDYFSIQPHTKPLKHGGKEETEDFLKLPKSPDLPKLPRFFELRGKHSFLQRIEGSDFL